MLGNLLDFLFLGQILTEIKKICKLVYRGGKKRKLLHHFCAVLRFSVMLNQFYKLMLLLTISCILN